MLMSQDRALFFFFHVSVITVFLTSQHFHICMIQYSAKLFLSRIWSNQCYMFHTHDFSSKLPFSASIFSHNICKLFLFMSFALSHNRHEVMFNKLSVVYVGLYWDLSTFIGNSDFFLAMRLLGILLSDVVSFSIALLHSEDGWNKPNWVLVRKNPCTSCFAVSSTLSLNDQIHRFWM